MNVYENIVIMDPALSDEEIEAATERIKGIITGADGEILKVDPWGRRKLAYELNKQTRGFYTLLLYRAPSSVVRKLEEFYKVFDPVFKYMVVKLEKKQLAATLRKLEEEKAPPAPAEPEPTAETAPEEPTTGEQNV